MNANTIVCTLEALTTIKVPQKSMKYHRTIQRYQQIKEPARQQASQVGGSVYCSQDKC